MNLFEIQAPSLLERLRHNVLPLDVEKKTIRSSIDIARSRVAALQGQAALVEIEALSEYVTQYLSLLAPIRRLPVDILRRIFLDPVVHEKKPRQTDPHSILLHYRPNTLGAVCYHWRCSLQCVSCETTTLWSNLAIFLNQPHRYTIDGLRVALQRSQKAPLHLAFRPVHSSSWSSLDTEMMQEVCKHSERWVHVEVTSNPELLRLLSPAENKLDSLQTLTIRTPSQSPFEPPAQPSKVFAHAPKLHTLRLIGNLLHSPSVAPTLPWLQFTRLCIDVEWNTSDYHYVLSHAQNVHELSALFWHTPYFAHLQATSHDLHKLHIHHVSQFDGSEVNVLNHLTAPALKELLVSSCKLDNLTMQSFLSRSSARLQSLALHDTPIRAADLVSLLRMVPTVERLVLANLLPNAVTNRVVQSLTASPSSAEEILLPMMTSFVIDGGYLFTPDALFSMLESRLASTNALSQLKALNIILPTLAVPAPRLESFANTAKEVVQSFRFLCSDETRRKIEVRSGSPSDYEKIGAYEFPN
ncbi:hypothetical protein R3P38DRAFT_2857845 [Favolaschia claudopus]|uniref:F-box domain-containing protein n=1 Tax=Favolaschia claudopus TaxID=2862362 RepID=A0AAW0DJ68_9AGAR